MKCLPPTFECLGSIPGPGITQLGVCHHHGRPAWSAWLLSSSSHLRQLECGPVDQLKKKYMVIMGKQVGSWLLLAPLCISDLKEVVMLTCEDGLMPGLHLLALADLCHSGAGGCFSPNKSFLFHLFSRGSLITCLITSSPCLPFRKYSVSFVEPTLTDPRRVNRDTPVSFPVYCGLFQPILLIS